METDSRRSPINSGVSPKKRLRESDGEVANAEEKRTFPGRQQGRGLLSEPASCSGLTHNHSAAWLTVADAWSLKEVSLSEAQ